MKKILLLIIIILVSYIMLIFINPNIANNIAIDFGFIKFNKKVIETKDKIDYISTKAPTKEELQSAYSGAKEKIGKLKENIDEIRKKAENVEIKYNEAKEFINVTGKKIDQVKNTIDSIQEVISTGSLE